MARAKGGESWDVRSSTAFKRRDVQRTMAPRKVSVEAPRGTAGLESRGHRARSSVEQDSPTLEDMRRDNAALRARLAWLREQEASASGPSRAGPSADADSTAVEGLQKDNAALEAKIAWMRRQGGSIRPV